MIRQQPEKMCLNNRNIYHKFIKSSIKEKQLLAPVIKQLALVDEANFSGLLAWYYLNIKPQNSENLIAAQGWAVKAIAAGSVEAKYHLAWILWKSNPKDDDIRRNLREVVKSKTGAFIEAASDLGLAYLIGVGGSTSTRWAVYWLEYAAARGDKLAKKRLLDVASKSQK